MNFLRKILLVTVVAVFAGNAEGMVAANGIITALPPAPVAPLPPPLPDSAIVDFDSIASTGDNVPASYQPKIYRNPVIGAPDKACVYFTVMNNGNPNNANILFRKAIKKKPVPANEVNIYFPADGTQPTTEEAAEYSCAREADTGDGSVGRAITKWYIGAFGGESGLMFAYGKRITDLTKLSTVITVGSGVLKDPPAFAKLFWRAFRSVAENPVGRVLLYRILIEVRRHDGSKGRCEDGLVPGNNVLKKRNACRSITVQFASDGCSFDSENGSLFFDPDDTESITVRIQKRGKNHIIDTNTDTPKDSYDICIVHEMLHWFHYLRHPNRYNNSNNEDPKVYRYLLRCYYGDLYGISELYTWADSIDDEEFRTILGSPNYNNNDQLKLLNTLETFFPEKIGACLKVSGRYIPEQDRYLEGDDLSENVYRISKEIPGGSRYRMRFGHGNSINKLTILNGHKFPRRFRLAHRVALDCYKTITGENIAWKLVSGSAAQ